MRQIGRSAQLGLALALSLGACKKTPPEVGPDVVQPPEGPDSVRFATPPGLPGASMDMQRAEQLLGSYRDQGGVALNLLAADQAQLDGAMAPMMLRWCVQQAQPVLCLQIKSPPTRPADSPWLVLVQQPDGSLVQTEVGERYVVVGAVAEPQRFVRLEALPDPQDLSLERRLLVGPRGKPLFCADAGALVTCEGLVHQVELMPLYSRLVERSSVVVVAQKKPAGCQVGVEVMETVGELQRRDLARIGTRIEPKPEHLSAISRASGIPGPVVEQAVWVDLNTDGKEELLFELNGPPDAEGRPGYSGVGVLNGVDLVPHVMEIQYASDATSTPPRVRLQGLADAYGDGLLGPLVGHEDGSWSVWRMNESGFPMEIARLDCGVETL